MTFRLKRRGRGLSARLRVGVTLFVLLGMCVARGAAQPYRLYTVEGLSQNSVYSMAEDPDGFLWAATANGLNRFDGTHTVQVTGLDPYGRPAVIRSRLVVDSLNGLWFHTGHFLMRMDTRTGTLRRWSAAQPSILMGTALPLAFFDGAVWLAAPGKLIRFGWPDTTMEVINAPGSMVSHLIDYDGRGGFWLPSGDSLIHFTALSRRFQVFSGVGTFRTLAAADSLLLTADGNQLHIRSAVNPTSVLRAFELPAAIGVLHAGRDGIFHAGTDEGHVVAWTPAGSPQVVARIPEGGPLHFQVLSLHRDRSGSLWAGADVAGLNRIDLPSQRVRTLPSSSGGSTGAGFFTYSIYRNHNDSLWVGTFKQGLIAASLTTGRWKRRAVAFCGGARINPETVYLLRQDASGGLWLGADRDLLAYREPDASCFTPVDVPLSGGRAAGQLRFFSFHEAGNRVIMGTSHGLFLARRENGRWMLRHEPRPFSGHALSVWLHDDGNRLFAGFEGNFWEVDLTSPAFPKAPLLQNGVNAITPSPVGRILWLATDAGPVRFNPDDRTFLNIALPESLSDPKAYAVYEAAGTLWVSTNQGLWQVRNFLSDAPVWVRQPVNPANGAEEFVTGAYARDANGNLYFGSISGPVWLNPEQAAEPEIAPRPLISRILVNEREHTGNLQAPFVEALHLQHNENQVVVRLAALHPLAHKGLQYRVRLDPWDRAPYGVESGADVRYSNLAPGSYTFYAAAAAADGVWSAERPMLRIHIIPPLWKRTWFLAVITLAGAGLISGIGFLIARVRSQQRLIALERRLALDEERLRLSREMHDDLGAGLTRITLLTEQVRGRLPAAGEPLMRVAETSRELIQSLQEIIWTLKPENAPLQAFLPYFRDQVGRLSEGLPLDVRITVSGESAAAFMLPPEVPRNVLLITREAINNALKYSKSEVIDVSLTALPDALVLAVSDQGIGFQPGSVTSGNGLHTMKMRAAALSGTFDLQTSPGKGTAITVRIPLNAGI